MNAQTPALYNDLTMRLDPADIEVVDRIGFFHADKAAALGRLIAVDGQRDPIKVVVNKKGRPQPWRLVAGMHRLEGVKAEGLPSVWAIEVFGKPEDLADLESSENLHRRPLGPIERAKFTAALVMAAQERLAREHGGLKQQQLAVKARWDRVKSGEVRAEQALKDEADDTCATIARVYGWQESVGEALSMSKRNIHYDLTLYRLLIEPFPGIIEALANHPVVGENRAQLKLIASIKNEKHRREVISRIIADPELSADEARVQAGLDQPEGRASTPFEKFTSQISGGWTRLGTAEKRRFLPTIADMVPGEMKKQLRDLLSEQLGDVGAATGEAAALKPAVPLRHSVKPDYIVCLEDGTRHLNLTTWLHRLNMTPAEYRARWKLPLDYPLMAPNHREKRRDHWRELLRHAAPKGAGIAKELVVALTTEDEDA